MHGISLRRRLLLAVTLYCLGACSSGSSIVQRINEQYCRILDDDYGDIRKRHFEELRASGENGRRALIEVAGSESPNRACAVMYLCALGDMRGLTLTRDILRDGDAKPDVLMNALSCVGSSRDPLYIEEIRPYLSNSDPGVSQFAVGALANIDDERARSLLRDLLAEPEHDYFQQVVIRGLAQLRDREAIPLIRKEANRPETNDLVRFESVVALAAIDAMSTLADTLELVPSIKTKATRISALESVWRALQVQLASLPQDASAERRAVENAIEEVKRRHDQERR